MPVLHSPLVLIPLAGKLEGIGECMWTPLIRPSLLVNPSPTSL